MQVWSLETQPWWLDCWKLTSLEKWWNRNRKPSKYNSENTWIFGGLGIASHDGIWYHFSPSRNFACQAFPMLLRHHARDRPLMGICSTPHVKLESLLGGPKPLQLDCWKLLFFSKGIYQSLGKRTHWESIKRPWNHNGWSNFLDHHIGLFGSLQFVGYRI